MKVYQEIAELVTLQAAHSKGGRHVTEKDLSIIQNGAFVASKGRIEWIGPTTQIPNKYKKAPKVNLRGRHVIPAFVECHSHLVFGGDRAAEFEMRMQGKSYQEIARAGGGIKSTVTATRKLSVKEMAGLAQVRAAEYLRQGVTTLEAKSGYGLTLKDEIRILQAQKTVKVPRIVSTFLGPHAVAPEFSDAAKYIDEVTRTWVSEVAKKRLASRADIFVEEGYFSVEQAKNYFKKAREALLDIVIHADQLTRSGGARLAVEVGARSADHLVQIDESDIDLLARSEVTCTLLPTSDLYLRMKYPPARALLDAGARVALATDFNPGSSPTQSLSLTGVLARLEMGMTLPEVIAAYTVNAAYALGLEATVGTLEVGKRADFLVLDGSWRSLFYSVGPMPVARVFADGRDVTPS